MLSDLLGLGEPIVLDDLVEKRSVRLVAIVGLWVLRQVKAQLANQRPIVPRKDLGYVGRWNLLRHALSSEEQDER
jgi:hypothetical protein